MRATTPAPAAPTEAPQPTVLHLFDAPAVDVRDRLCVAQFTAAGNVPDYTVETLANGNHMVRGLRIFRSGSFKDSKGRKNTWTPAQLDAMAENYNRLVADGLFVDVPWRADHSGSVMQVVGYVRGVRSDGKFLYADLEITEGWAWEKFQSGTFRARSAEIGFYESNDEELFYPVVCGVAFVDVGAVEQLYSRPDINSFSLLSDEQESSVTEEQFLAACAYAQALIDLGLTDVVTQADHQAAVAAARADAIANHQVGQPATFTINGHATQDYGAVQAHIATLETAAAEQASAARSEFVRSLAADNKIVATQIDTLTAVVLQMDEANFAAFKASYDLAPSQPLLSLHGPGSPNPAGEQNDLDAAIRTAEGIVAQHKRSGMKDDVLKETQSYKRLEALKAQKAGQAA